MEIRTVVTTIVAVTIGVILVGSLLVPEAQSVIKTLTDSGNETWANLIGVVVVVSIISLIVVALYAYDSRN